MTMTPLAALWLNQHVLSLMNQSSCVGRRVVSPLLDMRTRGKVMATSGGVYFDNCEVFHEMHPSQVTYPVRYTSVVPRLPAGKPMPQPPKLLDHQLCDGTNASKHALQPVKAESHQKQKRELGSKDLVEGRPSKRSRHEAKRSELSKEQQVFVDAALALSESGSFSLKSFPSPKNSPTASPRSTLQAPPPPPFFLASSKLDLKDTAKNLSSA